ncbi:MAG TPA: hypothetical protein ENK18_19490 [Deltaproteobacteria bacterium]|nr:hypothetical protein [Deltaproteobacteria bacterium]
MVETYESLQEIEEQLAIARESLRSFERGAGYSRLLQRLRTASPAHPVLLARFFCMALAVLCVLAGLVVLALPFVSKDLARQLVMFESVVSFVPYEVPAIPAVFAMLAIVMAVAWFLFTILALASGRDARMLPWEQREHQKLVNDVTRLSTQRAVMQRIQSTPAGSRPRLSAASSLYEPPSQPRFSAPGPSATGFPISAPRTTGHTGASSGGFSRHPTPSYTPYQGTSPGKPVASGGFGRPSYSTPADTPPRASGSFGGLGAAPGGFPSPAPPGTPEPASPQPPIATAVAIPSDEGDPPVNDGFGAPSGGWRSVLGESGEEPPPEPVGAPILGRIRPPEGFEAPSHSDALELLPPPGVPASEQPTEVPSNGMIGFGDYDDAAFSPAQGAPLAPPAPGAQGAPPQRVPPGGVRLGTGEPFGEAAPPPATEPVQLRPAAHPQPASSSLPHIPNGPMLAMPHEDDATEDFIDPQEPLEAEVMIDEELIEAENVGILSRARAGVVGSRATPYGSAGRIRPASAPLGKSTRSSAHTTSRVAPGAKPAIAAAPSLTAGRSGGLFGASRATARPDEAPTEAPLEAVIVLDGEDEEVPTFIANNLPGPERRAPVWESIPDRWLREALTSAEHLVRTFPDQAHIEYSQEPNLPFTLVISQATPAMAVRAMVNFVEFLASVYTPPRARIELIHVAHLDRSFHKNVEAALEPYFANNVVVEPSAGRIDIRFTDPDPGWGQYPMLPMR